MVNCSVSIAINFNDGGEMVLCKRMKLDRVPCVGELVFSGVTDKYQAYRVISVGHYDTSKDAKGVISAAVRCVFASPNIDDSPSYLAAILLRDGFRKLPEDLQC